VSSLNYSFTAGETKSYGSGKFFKIVSAINSVEVKFFSNNGSEIGKATFTQGDSVNIEKGFASVEVTSATAQTVEVITLEFILSSSNVVGDVNSVITNDYRDSNSISGNSYFAFMLLNGVTNNFSAGAGGFAACQLWNPAASGKTLLVKSLRHSCNVFYTDGGLALLDYVTFHTSLINTDLTEVNAIPLALSTQKNPLGPASVALLRGTCNAVRTYNSVPKVNSGTCETVVPGIFRKRVSDRLYQGGVIVPPGYGLVTENTGNVDNRSGTLATVVEYEEY